MLLLYCVVILCSVTLSSAVSAWCRVLVANKTNCVLLPRDGSCGMRPLKGMKRPEYGDSNAALGAYPWMACLQTDNAVRDKRCFCGGALISSWYVLTAARCQLDSRDQSVVRWVTLGDHDLSSDPDCEGEVCAPPAQRILIREFMMHGSYSTRHNDIALINLYQKVKTNNYVVPICLTYPGLFPSYKFNNTLVGWYLDDYNKGVGEKERTKVLQTSSMDSLSVRECRKGWIDHTTIDDTNLCGIPTRNSTGSPLIMSNTNTDVDQYFLIGINSYGATTWDGDIGLTVYTRVESYIPWILRKMVAPTNSSATIIIQVGDK